MLNKPHNSIVTLAAVLLALVGVSKPAKAFLLAQANTAPTTFTVPDTLPSEATVDMSTSNSTSSINQSLKESFADKFPEAEVNIETQSSEDALQALSEGTIDLVGIGRNLTASEKQKGFVAVPISREKIAIVVSNDNPYDGNLTISQFAQIFRGEITDWSEIGGQPGAINLIDSPDTNDTRQAFPSYPVFRESEFVTGSNTVQLDQDSTDEMIAQLGANGIGYAVANDVINRDDVKIVTMHQTQPDDERYPFSQPFYLVYQGTPSPSTEAFIGFATAQGGEQVVANRIGSMSTAAAVAIASKLGNKASNAPTGTADLPETTLDGEGDIVEPDANVEADGDVPSVDIDANAEADEDVPGVDTDTNAEIDGDIGEDGNNITGVNADAEIDGDVPGINADADANAEIDGDVPDIDVDANTEIGGNVDADGNNIPGINADTEADGDTVAQADPDLEDSGEVDTNPDLEGSGEVNPNLDLEGSGEVNPNLDLEDSGEVDPNLEGSGEVNPDLEGSGEANPDLEGSGEPNTAINTDGNTEIAPGATVTDDAEGGEAVATAKKGKWWWWLPLIIGLPILAAIAVSSFGGKKRSDQEPAIGTPNGNTPNGGGGVPNLPDGGDLSAVGANTATSIGNVAGNSVNTTSKLGGAAIATGGAAAIGGAAAANLAREKRATENALDDDIDIRLDDDDDTDINLDDTNINDPVIDEIPSNPVNEFTGQETKLQLTDQPTKLQTDTVEDIDENASGLLDSISNTGSAAVAGGAAAVGGAAAASGFFGDRTESLDEDVDATTINEEGQTTPQTGFVSEQTTKLQTNDIDSDFDANITEENVIKADNEYDTQDAQEFRGDFVLDEETTTEFSVDTDVNVENKVVSDNVSGLVDGTSNTGGAAAAGGAAAIGGAAASGFFGDRTESSDTEETDIDINTSGFTTDGVSNPEITEIDTDIEEINLDGNVSGDLEDIDTSSSDFTIDGVSNLETPEVDTEIDSNTSGWLDGISNKGSSAAAGGAAAIGGAAAASGFFGDRTESSDTEEINLDGNASGDLGDIDTSSSDFTTDMTGSVQTPEVETEIDDTEINSNTSGWLDGISNKGSAAAAGGAAAIGGAAAAASGFFGDRAESSDTEEINLDGNASGDLEDIDTSSSDFTTDRVSNPEITEIDTDIEEINLDGNVSGDLEDINTSSSDFTINMTGSVQTPEAETEIDDTEINSNTSSWLDDISNKGSAAAAGGAAAIGGAAAAASGFFGDRTESSDIEDVDIDPDISSSFSTDSGFANNVIADVETESKNTDINLDEITFDDVDTSINSSLEETSLERSDSSADISLDDITFDDVDSSADVNLDDITFDDVDSSADVNLDDITFDDVDTSINASLEERSLERTDNPADINLDDITFNDVDSSADVNLDDITFDDVDTSINASLEERSLERTDNPADINLDDITFNDAEDKSIGNITDNVDADSDNSELSFDDLGFDESTDDSTSDLLSGNAAKITDLSDDRSNDMNNISTWLDSLETPSQNSEDISGWLDQLNIQNEDSDGESADNKEAEESGDETEDISFQFLEDLLERDSDKENS